MKILGINNYNIFNSQPAFTERPRGEKVKEMQDTCNEAFKYLGIENRAIILHGSCFPSSGPDIGVGTPYSDPAKGLIKEFMMYGFNAMQLGPSGEISSFDISPYASKIYAKNPLFIDAKKLTKPEYAEILSEKTFDNITDLNKIKGQNYNYANFLEAFENIDIALEESYTTFKQKLREGDPAAVALNREFVEFKEKSADWLVNDGIFKILSKMNGTDDFTVWENQLDADLILRLNKGDRIAVKRYNQIVNRSKDKIDKNSFTQFLIDKQIRENKEFRDANHFTYINDLLVGCSKSDVWANREAFLPGYAIGCKYGGKDNSPQAWDLPVLNPKRLFKSDGSLDVAGQFLKNKLLSALEYCETVRIDHAMGLVDPWIYDVNSVYTSNGVVRSVHGNYISNMQEIDPDGNYRKILEKIVLPTLDEKGVSINDVVWEDLGDRTNVFNEIYYGKFNLPSIKQLEWDKGESADYNDTSLISSHDSPPTRMMNLNTWDKEYLVGYLKPDPAKRDEQAQFRQAISTNPLELIKAKFVDLFRSSKNIQMSFADFFAIDQRYNIPGQMNNSNWKLRMNNNYIDTYYKNLSSENPTAPNIPELLAQAVQSKVDMSVAKKNDKNPQEAAELRERLNREAQPLISHLNELAAFLKKPEPTEQLDLVA